MKVFQDSLIVNIPRSRFLPVKKTCDLMLVMSNLYTLDKGTLIMSPDRVYQTTPVVELGDEHFKKVGFSAFRHGFKNGSYASCSPSYVKSTHFIRVAGRPIGALFARSP